jgi:hypothetical protein
MRSQFVAASATERSINTDREKIRGPAYRYRPDSYCNPRIQNRRENRDVLFASPLGGCKRGNEAS